MSGKFAVASAFLFALTFPQSWAIGTDLGEQTETGGVDSCDVNDRAIGWCVARTDCPYSGYPESDCEVNCAMSTCNADVETFPAPAQCNCMSHTASYTYFLNGQGYVCATRQAWPTAKRMHPENATGFRCKGAGECVDGSGQMFAHVQFDHQNSFEECGDKCLELAGDDTAHFRGFTYFSDRRCNCHYDHGHLPSGYETMSDYRLDYDHVHHSATYGCMGSCGSGEVGGTDVRSHLEDTSACFGFRQADVGNSQCMAGTTGFTKVHAEKLSDSDLGLEETTSTETVTELQNLQVGDIIKGLDATKTPSDECEVVSISSRGSSVVYGNYTNDHYVLNQDGDLEEHGAVGESQEAEVFQVLSSCPLATDESGKKTTFSICGETLYAGQTMPWNVYLKIHSIMFDLVKTTGIHDTSALHDVNYAIHHLPGLCASGVQCAGSGSCAEFEQNMHDFINRELVTDAREKALKAFPRLGDASKPGSVSHLISKGKSSNFLRSGKKTLQQLA